MQVELEPPFLLIKPGISEEEFYRMVGEDGDWEYLGGRLVLSPASDRHEDLFSFLMTLLRTLLDARGGAVVRGSRYPMRLDPRWSPEPDLMVIRDEHRRRLMPQRLEGPADFVIEIASEGDPGFDLREKLPRYEEAGVEEIWWINPFTRTLLARNRTATGYIGQTLTAGRLASQVIPDFWIEVSWLWQDKLPSSFDCLRQILG